jgi:uncharacterized membrane protein
MLIDILLTLALLSIGLFAGLMMTLVVLLQRQWNMLEQEEYVRSFQGFLLIAKGNVIVTILTFASFILPVTIGVTHLIVGNTYPGAIVLAAGIVFFVGCFGVTMRLNFPIYAKVVGWKKVESATDWQEVRKRFYMLNIIRMSAAIVSFLFLEISALI